MHLTGSGLFFWCPSEAKYGQGRHVPRASEGLGNPGVESAAAYGHHGWAKQPVGMLVLFRSGAVTCRPRWRRRRLGRLCPCRRATALTYGIREGKPKGERVRKIVTGLLIALACAAPPALGSSSALGTLVGHTDSVNSVAYSPDGELLASGSSDQTVKLWDPASGTLLHTLTGHTDRVCSIGFSPDGTMIASSSLDTTIKLWNVSTGTLFRTFWGASNSVHGCCVAFSPSGWTLASTADDYTIKLWDPIMGTLVRKLSGHTQRVRCIVFSPNGRAITLASGSEDRTVRLWNPSTGKVLHTLTGHTGPVYSVAFSPDGKTLASGSYDGTIRLWDVVTGTLIRTIPRHDGAVQCLKFSPSGTTLASGTTGESTNPAAHTARVNLWDVATGERLTNVGRYNDPVTSLAFSPNGRVLAVGALDRRIVLWDLTAR